MRVIVLYQHQHLSKVHHIALYFKFCYVFIILNGRILYQETVKFICYVSPPKWCLWDSVSLLEIPVLLFGPMSHVTALIISISKFIEWTTILWHFIGDLIFVWYVAYVCLAFLFNFILCEWCIQFHYFYTRVEYYFSNCMYFSYTLISESRSCTMWDLICCTLP